jgi:hypothetical protein
VQWIHLAQDKVQWRGLVYAVMNLRVTQKACNFLTEQLLAFQWSKLEEALQNLSKYNVHFSSAFLQRSTSSMLVSNSNEVTNRMNSRKCNTQSVIPEKRRNYLVNEIYEERWPR